MSENNDLTPGDVKKDRITLKRVSFYFDLTNVSYLTLSWHLELTGVHWTATSMITSSAYSKLTHTILVMIWQ